jgi:circadian clock protein KaiC
MDTWIVLANDQVGDRHQRGLYVLKSRGMAHSNERCEFVLTNHGLHLLDAAGAAHGTADDADRGSPKGHDLHAVV